MCLQYRFIIFIIILYIHFTEDDEGNGDPHFIVTSHDQYQTKLCYDVNGNDGDVLLLLRDQEKSELNSFSMTIM